MLIPFRSKKFKDDLKLALKRGWPMEAFKELLPLLSSEEPIPAKYKDHPLKASWTGYRDIHIQFD
ncbi:MAG: type II toxin-antitoxin system YafQ family toxin [Deltaproteobacteria bacterium]|nr:type II toxin-antitoxin system YafQ family toxin [Deltaproteobacteria bacterium]